MGSSNSVALKAGIWYVIATFLSKGVVFFSTPIFTRILTQEEYGIVSTYNSWLGLLTVIATLDLYSCIQISKIDYSEDKDAFLSSVVGLSSLSIFVTFIITKGVSLINPQIIDLPQGLLDFVFLEIFFRNVFTLLQTQHRSYLKYKEFVVLSLIIACISPVLAIAFTLNMSNNKFWGNVLGNAIPVAIIALVLLYIIIRRGRVLYHKEYWKYSLNISLPLVPHHLAGNLLSQFDRVLINKYIGSKATAMYSVPSSYGMIIQMIWTAFNNAWVPWFYDKMKENSENSLNEIKTYVKPYLGIFTLIAIGVVALAPEAIVILGGKQYQGSEYCVVPIVLGIYCQFTYSLYSNIEFYYKKTKKIAAGTIVAALINLVLNVICIPSLGYIAAAYTTAISYAILLLIHFFVSKKIDNRDLYNDRYIFGSILCFFIIAMIFMCLYDKIFLRYVLLLTIIVMFLWTNKTFVFEIYKKLILKK